MNVILASNAGGIPGLSSMGKMESSSQTELNHLGEAIIETVSLDASAKDLIKR